MMDKLGEGVCRFAHYSMGTTFEILIACANENYGQQVSQAVFAEIDRIDANLGRFQGRIRRDNWVDQAKYLSVGDEAGFVERFGKLS